jgi:cystathionine gamma-synthase
VVDNTLATPFFQQPIALGADVVVHSTSKYLNGHSDVVRGIVITDDEELHREVAYAQNCLEAMAPPRESYQTPFSGEALALRMSARERNAAALAEFLRGRVDVVQVYYPGLKAHPQHELARRQMRGYGGIVSFRPRGGAARAREIARSTKLFGPGVWLGDDLLRLSVGIEDLDDLIDELGSILDGPLGLRLQPPRKLSPRSNAQLIEHGCEMIRDRSVTDP